MHFDYIPPVATGPAPSREIFRKRSTARKCLFFLGLMVVAARGVAAAEARRVERFDVVVVGGSSGAIGAAIGAARLGVSVALVEDTPVLGGMLANGISNIDSYSYESLSGLFEEFRQAVIQHYAPSFDTDPLYKATGTMPTHIDGKSFAAHEPKHGGRWEPHVSDRILKRMAEPYANLRIFYRRYATGAILNRHRVVGVTTAGEAGEPIDLLAAVVIDATHEADVAAWAGVPYRVGREARSELEPHAGEVFFFNHTGEFLPGTTGRQDAAIPSSGLRLCIKRYTEADGTRHIMTSPPPGYNPENYVHTAYRGERTAVPNGKAEMNSNPIGNELQQINWNWPEASREQRRALYQRYKEHALGFLYFLQHERKLTHLGLPLDEFVDNGNVPYRIFVREARRIEGLETMTEADINPFILGQGFVPPLRPTSIAIGHYPIDAKPVRSKTDFSTPDKGEGDFFLVNVATAFQVPYGAIVPRAVDGLLVPVALSATHVAFSSIRMDPTWMSLGQAAGIAAALSVKRNCQPRDLPVELLQRELLEQKLKLVFFWDVDAARPDFRAIQTLAVRGVVVSSPDRRFRPDDPLTRADAAGLLTRAFKLWPSVSNAHFQDVPYSHPAFRDIETLFDHGALPAFGIEPHWPQEGPYNAAQHAGFRQKNTFGTFRPDDPVGAHEWTALIDTLTENSRWSPSSNAAGHARSARHDVGAPLTRGEACQRLMGRMSPPTAPSR